MITPSTEYPPPAQEQAYPGRTAEMNPRPQDEMRGYEGRGLLDGLRALVTGGDSGIGRAVAVAFAKEGADVAIAPVDDLTKLSTEQWDRTFRVNIYSYFWTTRAALRHLPDGGVIINTASINGLRGNKSLVDYAATKGAVLALTYSLAQALQDRGIRMNSVAPGPVWTPLIPATFPGENVGAFGSQVPMGRAAHPDEVAPSYVFFASGRLSSYYSGEVLAPIGGETLPG